MFKAKLIDNNSYYKLRRLQLLLMLLPGIPLGLIINFYQIPIWLTIVMIGLYILSIILMVRNQKQLISMLGNKLIEINEQEIRIKSKKGIIQEIIKLDNIEKLLIKDNYSIPQETIKEIGKEITGDTKQNYLILQLNGENRKLDFEIDSYYMIGQLNKTIENWKTSGYKIESLNQE